jgi:hypothetical protein
MCRTRKTAPKYRPPFRTEDPTKSTRIVEIPQIDNQICRRPRHDNQPHDHRTWKTSRSTTKIPSLYTNSKSPKNAAQTHVSLQTPPNYLQKSETNRPPNSTASARKSRAKPSKSSHCYGATIPSRKKNRSLPKCRRGIHSR